MKTKIVSYYSIFIGISVIAMWIMIFLTDKPTEGKTELCFHLFSEMLMALLCIISGAQLLRKKQIGKSLNILGLGMLIYSLLNAAGYYGERNDYPMMIMFIILLFFTSLVIVLNIDFKVATKT